MTSVLSYITLAVHDLPRAVAFYRAVLDQAPDTSAGFPRFRCGTVWLALLTHDDLLGISGIERTHAGAPAGAPVSVFSFNVGSTGNVDRGLSAALSAGGVLTRPAGSTPWGGYAGWVRDPDGHGFEIVFNPKHPGGES